MAALLCMRACSLSAVRRAIGTRLNMTPHQFMRASSRKVARNPAGGIRAAVPPTSHNASPPEGVGGGFPRPAVDHGPAAATAAASDDEESIGALDVDMDPRVRKAAQWLLIEAKELLLQQSEDVKSPAAGSTAASEALVWLLHEQAGGWFAEGRDMDALVGFSAALVEASSLESSQPFGARTHVARSAHSVGVVLSSLNELDAAAGYLQLAHSIREASLGPLHQETLDSANQLASLLAKSGKIAEAKDLLQTLLADAVAGGGADSEPATNVRFMLANVYHIIGERGAAITEYERCMGVWGASKETELLLASAISNLALVLQDAGSSTSTTVPTGEALPGDEKGIRRADELLHAALSIRERRQGMRHPDTARVLLQLGTAMLAWKRHAEAAPILRRACDIFHAHPGYPLTNQADELLRECLLPAAQSPTP